MSEAQSLPTETAPPIPVDDKDLLSRFESLGDNCEFGLMQRYAGVEGPSLLRFNFTHLDRLLYGLENRFADLALDGNVRVKLTNEWMVRESHYRFSYHTHNADPTCDPERLLKQQTAWLRYMAGKFMERLEIGDRIYVRKGHSDTIESAIALGSHLRRYGPATLLWVTVADGDHPTGTVAWIGDGVMRGWIQRFAPYDRDPDLEQIAWIRLLRRAWALRLPAGRDGISGTNPRQSLDAELRWMVRQFAGHRRICLEPSASAARGTGDEARVPSGDWRRREHIRLSDQ